MHIHLLNCKSADALTRRLSLNKLELCMMVMEELEKTYASASIYRGVFLEAIRQLYPNYSVNTSIHQPDTIPTLPQAEPSNNSTTLPLITDDILDAFLDEASSMNFWESFGDIQFGALEPNV